MRRTGISDSNQLHGFFFLEIEGHGKIHIPLRIYVSISGPLPTRRSTTEGIVLRVTSAIGSAPEDRLEGMTVSASMHGNTHHGRLVGAGQTVGLGQGADTRDSEKSPAPMRLALQALANALPDAHRRSLESQTRELARELLPLC